MMARVRYIKCISISSKFLLTSRTLITFNKINKDLYYKMHVLGDAGSGIFTEVMSQICHGDPVDHIGHLVGGL